MTISPFRLALAAALLAGASTGAIATTSHMKSRQLMLGDLNTIRTTITVLAMLAFLGIVAWAWSSRRRADFDAAARLPLEEDGSPSAFTPENRK